MIGSVAACEAAHAATTNPVSAAIARSKRSAPRWCESQSSVAPAFSRRVFVPQVTPPAPAGDTPTSASLDALISAARLFFGAEANRDRCQPWRSGTWTTRPSSAGVILI